MEEVIGAHLHSNNPLTRFTGIDFSWTIMSTRQLRLTQTDQIQKKVADLVGKRINVVLSDKTAMFGELHAVEAAGIVLKNMRQKKMHYAFTQISEVYFDSID